MISLSCFACTKGLQCVLESAINSDSGDFHSNVHIFVVAENRRKNRKNVRTTGACGAHMILIAKNAPNLKGSLPNPMDDFNQS